ncbi:hypothetical protein D3C72_2172070 [compost metagenome]
MDMESMMSHTKPAPHDLPSSSFRFGLPAISDCAWYRVMSPLTLHWVRVRPGVPGAWPRPVPERQLYSSTMDA